MAHHRCQRPRHRKVDFLPREALPVPKIDRLARLPVNWSEDDTLRSPLDRHLLMQPQRKAICEHAAPRRALSRFCTVTDSPSEMWTKYLR